MTPSNHSAHTALFPWKNALLLFLAALVLYLSGNGAHSLWDRDEARFSEATREMVEAGDWIVPRLNGEIRHDKPVLIYWLMSVPMRIWGVNAFSVRFPAAVAGSCTIVLVFLTALAMGLHRAHAAYAALTAMSFGLLLLVSKAATTDGVLTLTVLAALCLHWFQMRRDFRWWRHFLFYAALAASALVKGPPGLAVIGFGVWVDRLVSAWMAKKQGEPFFQIRGANLVRTLAGLAFFFALTLPWTFAVNQATDGEFMRVALGHHVVNRSTSALEGHSGPIVYYLVLLPFLVFPMTPLFLNALPWVWRNRGTRAVRFLLAALLPSLLMFSLVKTKLPHYVAPLLPLCALLIGFWWKDYQEKENPGRWWWRIGGGLALLMVSVLPAAYLLAPQFTPGFSLPVPQNGWHWLGLALGLAGVGTLWAGAFFWMRLKAEKARPCLYLGAYLLFLALPMGPLSMMETQRPSPIVARWIRANAPHSVELLASDYKEPSLMFYFQGKMEEVGANKTSALEVLERFRKGKPLALVITRKRWEKWQSYYEEEAPLPPKMQERWSGKFYDFQKGRPLELLVVGNWRP